MNCDVAVLILGVLFEETKTTSNAVCQIRVYNMFGGFMITWIEVTDTPNNVVGSLFRHIEVHLMLVRRNT
jgi:hypothetical protein